MNPNYMSMSHEERARRNNARIVGLCVVGIAVTIGILYSQDADSVQSEFSCNGEQTVTATSGDTYSDLVVDNVSLPKSASNPDVNRIVGGLSLHEYDGSPVVIPAGTIAPESRDITAGNTYVLPTNCAALQN